MESSRMEIPSKSEIDENINNNKEGFRSFLEHERKSTESANGIEFNDYQIIIILEADKKINNVIKYVHKNLMGSNKIMPPWKVNHANQQGWRLVRR